MVIFLRVSSAAATRCCLTGRLRESLNWKAVRNWVASLHLPHRPWGSCPACTLPLPLLPLSLFEPPPHFFSLFFPLFLPTFLPFPSPFLSLHSQLEVNFISLKDIFPFHKQGINLSSCLENESRGKNRDIEIQALTAGLESRYRVREGSLPGRVRKTKA